MVLARCTCKVCREEVMNFPPDPSVEKKIIQSRRRERLATQFLTAAITGETFEPTLSARILKIQRAIQLADTFIKEFDKSDPSSKSTGQS